MNQLSKTAPGMLTKWFRGHLRAMKEGILMPLQSPLSGLFTVITLGICFYLPLVLWSVWVNFSELQEQWQAQGSVAIFLKKGLEASEVTALKHELTDRNLISQVTEVDNNTIRDSLNKDPQLEQIISVIKAHELPDQLLIKTHPNATADQIQTLVQKLQLHADVDYVSFDADWFQQLKTLTRSLYYLTQASIAVFFIIIFVFLSHTIGSEVAAHKGEINLKQLLGATAAQIRRRFLYGGVYYGLAAAALAVLLLELTLWWLEQPIQELTASFGQAMAMRTPDLDELMVFAAIVVMVTWLGSRVSAGNHLRQIQ